MTVTEIQPQVAGRLRTRPYTPRMQPLRIGNNQGFWGDDADVNAPGVALQRAAEPRRWR